MAQEDVRLALVNPGRLCFGPTQAGLLADYPHGGTALGIVRAARLVETPEIYAPTKEENARRDTPYLGPDPFDFLFVLAQVDPDAWKLRNRVTTTSGGGFSGVGYGDPAAATLREGQAGPMTVGAPLLFSPRNRDQFAVLIYAPVYFAGPGPAASDHSWSAPLEFPTAVMATEDANGLVVACERLEHLNLTG